MLAEYAGIIAREIANSEAGQLYCVGEDWFEWVVERVNEQAGLEYTAAFALCSCPSPSFGLGFMFSRS